MALFDAVDIIRTKRDGGALTPEQIDWTIDAYTKGVVRDEQMAALAMAVFLRGMTRDEIARWTDAMIRSGERMDFSGIGKPTADKHSTGGVGDKIRPGAYGRYSGQDGVHPWVARSSVQRGDPVPAR